MSLAKKYGISEEAVKQMVRDGHLSALVIRDQEILDCFEAELKKGVGNMQARYNTAQKVGLCERQVYNIVNKMK